MHGRCAASTGARNLRNYERRGSRDIKPVLKKGSQGPQLSSLESGRLHIRLAVLLLRGVFATALRVADPHRRLQLAEILAYWDSRVDKVVTFGADLFPPGRRSRIDAKLL